MGPLSYFRRSRERLPKPPPPVAGQSAKLSEIQVYTLRFNSRHIGALQAILEHHLIVGDLPKPDLAQMLRIVKAAEPDVVKAS